MGNPPLVQCLRALCFMRHCAMFSVWPWLQRYRFPKADVKVIVDFLVKEREFNSFYLSLHAQKHEKEKKKRNCWKANFGSPCPIFLLHVCCFQPCSFSELLLCCHFDNKPHCISSIRENDTHLPSTSCHQSHQHFHLSLVHSPFHQSLPPQYWSFACLSHLLMSLGTRSLDNCFPSPNVM